jgi:hypothetical protein
MSANCPGRSGGIPGWFWLLLCSSIVAAAADGKLPQLTPIPPGQSFTFAVLGDNRGDDSGQQPAAFRQILRAVNEASPAFAVNTGDMIYGHTANEVQAREYWRIYRAAAAQLKAPMFHIPGNHDIWSEASARLYAEMLGPTYYAFDYGRARFIGLDCETDSCRLGVKQFEWLRQQLEARGQRLVFVFLHRPLFPVDGAIGSSMDAYTAERDQLHQLLVQHRRAIQGVFLGHEHLYHRQERDGVPYYITGGAGANLYMAPELGGFHHFLLVRVDADQVAVELKKVGAPVTALRALRRVAPGELLESWEQGMFWGAWNYTVTTEITSARASEGQRGLQMNFDLAQCPWPVLMLPLPVPWEAGKVEAFALDVFLPDNLSGNFSLTASVEGVQKHEAPPVRLAAGWNTVRTPVNAAWRPAADRSAVRSLGWGLSCDGSNTSRGSVVFDNFRIERRGAGATVERELLEGWERPLFWRVADESVRADLVTQFATNGQSGLRLSFDFAQCARPVLLARLNPPWDLTRVGTLTVDVYVPGDLPGPISATLGLRAKEAEFPAPPVLLRSGWNQVKVPLDGRWLPKDARAATEQVEWTLSSPSNTLRGWVVFDNLRAAEP